MSTKRTYQPSKTRRMRAVGYRARTKTSGGKKVLKRRRKHSRRRIAR